MRTTMGTLAAGCFLLACAPPKPQRVQPPTHRNWSAEIHQAVLDYYPDLLRGSPLANDARAIWFISDPDGRVLDHGIRDSLPETVAFKAIPRIVPETKGRRYDSFTLTSADSLGAGASVGVLWIVLRT